MTSHAAQRIFEDSRPALPPDLSARITLAIEKESLRKLQFQAHVASVCSFLSLILFFISLSLVGKSLVASDFWQLAALLFSDLSLVLAHAEAFLLSLAETFPAASVSLVLLPLFFHLTALILRSQLVEASATTGSFQMRVAH